MATPSRAFDDATVTVTSTLTRLGVYNVRDVDNLAVHLSNTGAALTAFQLRGQVKGTGPLAAATLKSSGFTTPDVNVYFASVDPTTLASGGASVLYLNTTMLESVELWATCATSTAVTALVVGYP